jgi:regulator of sirC expression with transglutaminase-like and TPR domain
MTGTGDEAERSSREQREAALRVVEARRRFTALCQRADRDIDLAEAALLIAAEEYPGLDVAANLAKLDVLGERVRQYAALRQGMAERADPDEASLAALHQVLFEEEGFVGAEQSEYYRPRNCYLNEVLERKRGMPILLALVYCEVARRAGMDAVGIALPFHFIAQFRGAHTSVLVDPYNRGARLTREACAELVQRVGGAAVELTPDHFRPAPRKQILVRILNNLKGGYLRRGALRKALAAVERILLVSPSLDQVLDQVRDRGILLLHLDQPGAAWFDLSLYARLAEGAPDAAAIRESADRLWKQMGRMN